MPDRSPPACLVITGASSGIGAALARRYAGPGRRLGLTGRNPERLEAVATAARQAGATCETLALDVRERGAFADWLRAFDAAGPVDCLVVNAGMLDGRHGPSGVESGETARTVLEVNLLASVDVIHALLPAFQARRRGQLALVASLAAFSPLPDAPAYGASKAGLLSYGLALRAALHGSGVSVSVACPGYVTSAMTAQHQGHRPGEIDADHAARLIARGLERDREVIGFPGPLYWLSRVSALAPEFVRRAGMQGLRFRVGERQG